MRFTFLFSSRTCRRLPRLRTRWARFTIESWCHPKTTSVLARIPDDRRGIRSRRAGRYFDFGPITSRLGYVCLLDKATLHQGVRETPPSRGRGAE